MIYTVLYTANALAVILAVAGWPWLKRAWPVVKAWASTRGVGLFAGDEMILFPIAAADPTTAVHMKLFGVEAKDWFVGVFRSKTLVKQQVVPGKVTILGPND